jgi:hypothetical protein
VSIGVKKGTAKSVVGAVSASTEFKKIIAETVGGVVFVSMGDKRRNV